MDYQVFAPAPELESFVKCFWTLEDAGSSARQRIVPDGCMEMIFHYADAYLQYFDDGSSIVQPKSFVFGQITSYIEIAPTGATGIVAARFHPGGLMPFLDVPVASLENKANALSKLFGKKGILLEQQVLASPDNQQRIKLIERFLLSRLSDPATIDKITKACVEAIIQSQGQLGVLELASKMKLNRRNLERRFISAIGMSPKQLSKVIRLQATLKTLEQEDFTSLTSLAYDNGYYDQAHFNKDFREFTGLSPKSFFAGNLKLSALFTGTEDKAIKKQ